MITTGQLRKKIETQLSKITDTPEDVIANRLRAVEILDETDS